jgi:hypothetical protein
LASRCSSEYRVEKRRSAAERSPPSAEEISDEIVGATSHLTPK